MRKVYKKLTEEQKKRNVVFSSCLSELRTENESETTHEIFKDDADADIRRKRLLDDKFFNKSPYNFNIIRN